MQHGVVLGFCFSVIGDQAEDPDVLDAPLVPCRADGYMGVYVTVVAVEPGFDD